MDSLTDMIVEDDSVPEGMAFLVPQLPPTRVYVPVGTSAHDAWLMGIQARIDDYVAAAKRGEIGVIKGLKTS